MQPKRDPFANHLRLKSPCSNCPFRLSGGVHLEPGRLQGIIEALLDDDMSSFDCHKTVHCDRGGEWDEDGAYQASGHEAMCAGAAVVLMKRGRPTVAMRFAFITGKANPGDWDNAKTLVVD